MQAQGTDMTDSVACLAEKLHEANGLFAVALREMKPEPALRAILLAAGRLPDRAELIADEAPQAMANTAFGRQGPVGLSSTASSTPSRMASALSRPKISISRATG
jgi:hypothetical protein